MKVFYLLSRVFDYEKLISGDAGPRFAADYGLGTVTLDSEELESADYLVVDNRFPQSEFDELLRFMAATKAVILLKVVDPQWRKQDRSWYRFVRDLVDRPKVHLALTYSESELTALYLRNAEKTQSVFMPYVYDEAMERPLGQAGRKRSVALSGQMISTDYPLRTRMALLSRAFPPFWLLVDHLGHPGYPDLGQRRRHDIIGHRYIEWLAQHRFAFVCSSSWRLELLKYREVAYAGCVPVGDMPYTLLDCPQSAYIPFRKNVFKLTQQLLAVDDAEAAAKTYREFLRERRGAPRMRKRLAQQLGRLS